MAKIKLSEEARRVLVILGEEYRRDNASSSAGMLVTALLARAGMYNSSDVSNFFTLSEELQRYGFTSKVVTTEEIRIFLTDKGWKYLNPWYKKMWGWFKGDLRAIIVATITTIIVYLLTNWLSKLFEN